MITLLLGGARSGKSIIGERLVLAHPGPVHYVATGVVTDPDMAARIDAHRAGRDPRFVTVEVGADLDLAATLRALPDRPALVDALGPWVARHLGPDGDLPLDAAAVASALRERRAPTVVVSDEVGLGVHPESGAGRRFRDVLGALNQAVAAEATDVHLVVAGRLLPLRTPDELGL